MVLAIYGLARRDRPFFEAFPYFITAPVHGSAYLWTGYTGGQHNPPPYLAGDFR